MASYLGFDVYDLELTAVRSDSDLRRLLIRTANWSIIMVEDIDCSLSLDSPRTATPKGVEVLLQSRIWGTTKRGRIPPPVKDMGNFKQLNSENHFQLNTYLNCMIFQKTLELNPDHDQNKK
ncbi:hypothetical protein RJ640_025010 [Escallonia rubra]|uniref:Uncharacterized protein n=1 Tax=Escallonia rubra TaxID=112253 RepID=A0AA88US08_9ASTE|nr:hypothetical protein RJ640_025010 [Escallonia rubra]